MIVAMKRVKWDGTTTGSSLAASIAKVHEELKARLLFKTRYLIPCSLCGLNTKVRKRGVPLTLRIFPFSAIPASTAQELEMGIALSECFSVLCFGRAPPRPGRSMAPVQTGTWNQAGPFGDIQEPARPLLLSRTFQSSTSRPQQQVSLTADNIMELVSTCMVVLEAPFPNTSTNAGMFNGAQPHRWRSREHTGDPISGRLSSVYHAQRGLVRSIGVASFMNVLLRGPQLPRALATKLCTLEAASDAEADGYFCLLFCRCIPLLHSTARTY